MVAGIRETDALAFCRNAVRLVAKPREKDALLQAKSTVAHDDFAKRRTAIADGKWESLLTNREESCALAFGAHHKEPNFARAVFVALDEKRRV